MIRENRKSANVVGKGIWALFGGHVTKSELAIVVFGSLILPLAVPVYSLYGGFGWSVLQMVVAYGIAFDIMSGCLLYNSVANKKIRYRNFSLIGNLGHALLHMQPLVVASFFTERLFPVISLYWLVLYVVFVALFEPISRVSQMAERVVLTILIAINILFLVFSFEHIDNRALFAYGAVNYILLAPLTILQFFIPARSQRLFGTLMVIFVIILNMMLLSAPEGFHWFVPILYIKIFMGYNALENVQLTHPGEEKESR